MIERRLRHQGLVDSRFRTAAAAVSWLGAVQAQDYSGAAWALGLRVPGLTAADVDEAFAAGRILRTHVLRPTWHFVTPADIHWMLALTGPRVQAMNLGYGRRHGFDRRVFTRARVLIERALEGGQHLTRQELGVALQRGRIAASAQGLSFLVMGAEFEGAICSGPRRGKQFTYALLAERAPRARVLPRDEALATLACRYFQSHGPATVCDFAWWSGLTMRDARAGAASVGERELVLETPPGLDRAPGAHLLLPNYDEYLIAHRDRGAVIDPARARNLGIFTTLEYPHQILVDGRVVGSWCRTITATSVGVGLRWYQRGTARHVAALRREAARFGRFFGVPGRIADGE